MVIWRLSREPYASLEGEGARLYGARWNSVGVPVVCAASHLSLAALEYLVHIDIEDVPSDLVALSIQVPDRASQITLRAEDMPPDWRNVPVPRQCAAVGDDWVGQGDALLLRVPSVLVPEEENVLLNPRHPEATKVGVVGTRRFVFDTRLLDWA